MKFSYSLVVSCLSLLSIACGGPTGKTNADIDSTLLSAAPSADLPKGKIVNPVRCESDPTQSYALYIPAGSGGKPLPVVYFFDAHGDGLLPVKKYKALADSFHFILAGSNNSKNGNDWNQAENIWSVFSDDVQKRVPVDPDRMYTCGFSGGAKVATFIGLHHQNIKGVIANGAGLEDVTTAGKLPFSFTAITGNGDLNMTDLVSIDNILDKSLSRHRIIFFKGIHEWAPESAMALAFDGLQFDAMRKNLIPVDTAFLQRFTQNFKEKIAEDVSAKKYLEAAQNCGLATSMLDDVSGESQWFHQKRDSILAAPGYQYQDRERQQVLATEERIKSEFQQHFQQEDNAYWKRTIAEVKSKANGKTADAAMYQRLDAYLSLAFYSLGNQMISQNQNDAAAYFVSLYKKVDPSNPEAWYFSAILNARKNNAAAAKADLEKAVALGFNDKQRLEQQPEFTNSQVDLELGKLERQMR